LNQQLEALVESGLVYRLGEGADASFQFKHALIQDAAYASLLRDRRATFHDRAAHYLEDLYQQGHKLADLLSYHFTRAGIYDKGLKYARIAGETALSTSAVIEALEHFQNALEVLPNAEAMPESNAADLKAQELEVQLGLAACYRFQDQYDDALERLARAEVLARELHDIGSLSDICNVRGNIYFPVGNLDGCLNEHQRSLEFAKQAGSLEREARAIGGLGDAYYVRGEMKIAVVKFRECCEMSLRHGFTTQYAANRAMIGWSRLYQLEITEAREDGLEAIRACQEYGHLRGEMNANALLGWVYSELHDRESARKHNENAIAIAHKLGTLNFVAAVKAFDCRSRDVVTEKQEIKQNLDEALAISRELGHGFHGPAIIGALLLVTDDPAERDSYIEEAERILEEGCVGHNNYWFYQDAIQAALNYREWDNLPRFRSLLVKHDDGSVCEMNQFYIARSEVLESIYRGRVTESVLARRQELIDIARRHSLFKPLVELEAAGM
jgi:tetratricopeptide (TPR) repeat protein